MDPLVRNLAGNHVERGSQGCGPLSGVSAEAACSGGGLSRSNGYAGVALEALHGACDRRDSWMGALSAHRRASILLPHPLRFERTTQCASRSDPCDY